MNIIAFFELDPDDFDEVIEKYNEVMAEREKGTEKYPKILFPSQSMDEWTGFVIYEDPTSEQLINITLQFKGLLTLTFKTIFDSLKTIEIYQKTKA